jgi:hypothetical protein
MSSLMRLLSHRSSAAENGNNEAGNSVGFASSTPRSGSSFPASPSINDFSMGTAADVAEWGELARFAGAKSRVSESSAA